MKSGFNPFLSAFICGFRNTAAGANEPPPLILVHPFGQRRTLRPVLALVVMMVMFTLSVLCAAMFTEPAIPQIEEVGRLVHRT
jgi:hypothetical protein